MLAPAGLGFGWAGLLGGATGRSQRLTPPVKPKRLYPKLSQWRTTAGPRPGRRCTDRSDTRAFGREWKRPTTPRPRNLTGGRCRASKATATRGSLRSTGPLTAPQRCYGGIPRGDARSTTARSTGASPTYWRGSTSGARITARRACCAIPEASSRPEPPLFRQLPSPRRRRCGLIQNPP